MHLGEFLPGVNGLRSVRKRPNESPLVKLPLLGSAGRKRGREEKSDKQAAGGELGAGARHLSV